ncbi:hypothetical protein IAT38_001696 [Cryptococcus sp. DSM 104549]
MADIDPHSKSSTFGPLTDSSSDPSSRSNSGEPCPLCPSGPPRPPAAGDGQPDVPLVWIACTKCGEWFHSACLYLGDEKVRSTIPKEILEEVEKSYGEQGAWANWADWIGKWYCHACLERSVDPSNPRPPRHPLVAGVKAGAIPRKEADTPRAIKRSASDVTLTKSGSKPKKARASVQGQSAATPELEGKDEGKAASGEERDAVGVDAVDSPAAGSDTTTQGRPKRKVVQIDYHNLNNSIATPTSQWLELIADPDKFGRTILDAEYKTLPGKLLTRAWLESTSDPSPTAAPTAGPSSPSSLNTPQVYLWGPNREPLIIRPEDGGFSSLGGHIPGKDFTVQEVARLVGRDKVVDVIDVASQQSSKWTIQKWADYLQASATASSSGRSPKVYNIISLEISDTNLAKRVRPPRIVRDIDWVDNYWDFGSGGKGKGKAAAGPEKEGNSVKEEREGSQAPTANGGGYAEGQEKEGGLVLENGVVTDDAKKDAQAPYPKVQLYCLMGMKGAWTDWHVDFAASSVYYTIHTGSKVFYFIRPTEKNLKAYAEWSGSYEKQQDTWLGDMVDEVRKVVLKAGDTMIIPAGYIHAVYTPEDTIVFGGNFLHSYDIDTQLRMRQIEIDTKVPQRFRFPMFDRLCWYVADKSCADLRALRAYRPRAQSSHPQPPHHRVLQGLLSLSNFLIAQYARLHNPTVEDKIKKLVWERIPHDVVKDAEGLARELKWRVERELGEMGLLEEGEVDGGVKEEERKVNGKHVEGRKGKGKEAAALMKKKQDRLSKIFDRKPVSRTWAFSPQSWSLAKQTPEIATSLITRPRATSSHIDTPKQDEEAEMTVSSTKQIRRRVRETTDGMVVEEVQESTFVERTTVWDGRVGGERNESGDKVGTHVGGSA